VGDKTQLERICDLEEAVKRINLLFTAPQIRITPLEPPIVLYESHKQADPPIVPDAPPLPPSLLSAVKTGKPRYKWEKGRKIRIIE
jgi:hypothetical protein